MIGFLCFHLKRLPTEVKEMTYEEISELHGQVVKCLEKYG